MSRVRPHALPPLRLAALAALAAAAAGCGGGGGGAERTDARDPGTTAATTHPADRFETHQSVVTFGCEGPPLPRLACEAGALLLDLLATPHPEIDVIR